MEGWYPGGQSGQYHAARQRVGAPAGSADRSDNPIVDELVTEGLVTLEAARVLKYADG
jgi:hypothetical protein